MYTCSIPTTGGMPLRPAIAEICPTGPSYATASYALPSSGDVTVQVQLP